MAPDLHLRPLRGPSQIESLVWSEGVHLNNSSFVRISASRSERPLIRGLTIRVLIFAVGSRGFESLVITAYRTARMNAAPTLDRFDGLFMAGA